MTSTGREHTTFVRQFQQTAVSTFSGQSSYTAFYTFLSVAVISFSQQTWQVRRLGCKKTWGHRPVSVISGTQVKWQLSYYEKTYAHDREYSAPLIERSNTSKVQTKGEV